MTDSVCSFYKYGLRGPADWWRQTTRPKVLCAIFLPFSERIQKMSKALALGQRAFITSDWLNGRHYVSQPYIHARYKGEKKQHQQRENLRQPSCSCYQLSKLVTHCLYCFYHLLPFTCLSRSAEQLHQFRGLERQGNQLATEACGKQLIQLVRKWISFPSTLPEGHPPHHHLHK